MLTEIPVFGCSLVYTSQHNSSRKVPNTISFPISLHGDPPPATSLAAGFCFQAHKFSMATPSKEANQTPYLTKPFKTDTAIESCYNACIHNTELAVRGGMRT